MAATPINFNIDAGADFSAELTLTDDNGLPINLTSFALAAKYSKSYTNATKTTINISIVNAAAGKIKITLTAAQTALMTSPRYVYDVVITAPINFGGTKTRVIEGLLYVSQGVT
jgi:hypothetical protein